MSSESSEIDMSEEPSVQTLREVSLESEKPKHSRHTSMPLKPSTNVSYIDFLQAFQGSTVSPIDRSSRDDIHSKIVESLKNVESKRKSLPIFGAHPCSAFCANCFREVHTSVVFKEHNLLTRKLLDVITTALGCCSMPAWLTKLRIHKCPNCDLTLGNIVTDY